MGAYNDDVLFIHIPKCGGTSAKHYMADVLLDLKWPRPSLWFAGEAGRIHVNAEDKRLHEETVQESRLPIGHIPLRDIERFTGRPPSSWERIIAIVRYPYAQQVSQWWFWHCRYAKGDNHPSDIVAGMHSRFGSWLREPKADFHKWYEVQRFSDMDAMRVNDRPSGEDLPYYLWWLEVDGAVPDNVRVLKMEEMETTLPAALAPFCDGPMPEIPHRNKGGGLDWRHALEAGLFMNPDGSVGGREYVEETLAIMQHKFRWTFEQGLYQPLALVDES